MAAAIWSATARMKTESASTRRRPPMREATQNSPHVLLSNTIGTVRLVSFSTVRSSLRCAGSVAGSSTAAIIHPPPANTLRVVGKSDSG